MVQTYESPVRVYKHPFELMMKAYEKRFPTSPLIPIFLECDVTSEFQAKDGSLHAVDRRCKLAIDVPWMLKKIVGIDHAIFLQKNALDRKNRKLLIEAENESFAARVAIKEKCTYFVHPENPDWTCFTQEASLDVKSFFGFESTVEKIAVRTYSTEIARARETLMIFLKQLETDGVTHVPPWKPGEREPMWGDAPEVEEVDAVTEETSFAVKESADAEEALKMDTEYIERCLGALSMSQQSGLVQLKKRIMETHQGKMPSDSHLLRFLRARDFNVEKAEEMICRSLLWRKQYVVDSILATYVAPELMSTYIAGAWHRRDNEGRPVYIFRLGHSDVKGVMKSVGEEPILRHMISLTEEGVKKCQEATQEAGEPISTITCILDLEGLSMRHLWRPGIKTLIKLIEIMEANYPETLGSLVMIRAPRIFPILWTLIYPCLDVNTRQKCVIYDESQAPLTVLSAHMDESLVPEFLGGACTLPMSPGGLVPKDLQTATDDESSFTSGFNSVYDRVTLTKGFPHEVILSASEECVITWDFDVIRGDVMFSIFFSSDRHIVDRALCTGCRVSNAEQNQGCAPLIGSYGELLETGSTGDGAVQIMPRHDAAWERVESTRLYKEKDSVQGSLTIDTTGSYVLQWRQYEKQKTPVGAFDFPSLAAAGKSKVMLFTELIASTDVNGSISSFPLLLTPLQSGPAASTVMGQCQD